MSDSEQVRRSLQSHKRRVVSAIRDRDPDAVKDGLRVYRELVQTFLQTIQQYGLQYDRDAAAREGGALAGAITGWEGIDWIRNNYLSFLDAAFEEADRDILLTLLYFPYSLAARAIPRGDYYVFQKFVIERGTAPYILLNDKLGSSTRSIVIDRLGRYPREFIRFHVRELIGDKPSRVELAMAKDIVEDLIRHIGDLMKEALDRDRINDFKAFRDSLRGLRFRRWWDLDNHRNWHHDSRAVDEATMREMYGEESHELHRAYETALKGLERSGRLVYFGLAAWIIRGFTSGSSDTERTQRWLQAVGAVGNLRTLLETFAHALKFQTQERFGWDRWIVEGAPEDTVITIDAGQYLPFVLIYFGASQLPVAEEQNVLPNDIELARLLSDSAERGGLQSALDTIEENPGDWEALFDHDPLLTVVRHFRELCDRIEEEYDDLWTEKVRTARPSETKVSAFRCGFASNYEQKRRMAEVLKREGALTTVQESAESYRDNAWKGVNHLLEKEYFVEEGRMMVQPLGEQFGEQLARLEQGRVLSSLLEADIAVANFGEGDDPVRVLSRELARLEVPSDKCAVLLFGGWSLYRSLEMNDVLEDRDPGGSRRPEAYVGKFEGASVYRLHSRVYDGTFVGNIGDLGIWRQFEPHLVGDEDEDIIAEFVRFSLSALEREQAEAIVAAAEEDGREFNYTAQELREQKLHLLCRSRVEWCTREANSAVWVRFQDQ